MANFEHSWSKPQSAGMADQIRGAIKKEGPLKPKVENAVRKVSQPIAKLDYMSNKLAEKDAKLFKRIVEARQRHNMGMAKALANELVELRKNEKVISNMRVSLEQVQLRLTTVNEVGDMISSLQPALATMRVMGPALAKFMPEASAEFESMGNALGGMMSNTFDGSFESDAGTSSETDSILSEASAVASAQIGQKFPSAPTSIGSSLDESSAESY